MDERIGLKDTMPSVIIKLSDGNPGALRVCMEILEHTTAHDPDNVLGGIGVLLFLDTLGIYGSRIWMLYKDFCKENISTTILVLRGWQLGIISKLDLNHAIDNYGNGLDIEDIVDQVQKELPNFIL